MKQQFLLFSFLIILFSACKKEGFNASTQATIDDDKIKAYIAANHIDVTKDQATGIYYKITNLGTAGMPNINDTVKISYTGSLLNGTVFQAKSTSTDAVLNFIKGFQIALPLMNLNPDSGKTCRMRLILPSVLAYGNTASADGSVPANAPLDFTIDLQGFYGPQ